MKQQLFKFRNILIVLAFFIPTYSLLAQEISEEFDLQLVKSFFKNLRIPQAERENCAETIVFLAVEIDKNSKVSGIKFSDSASSELKDELKKIIPKIDVENTTKNLKVKGIRNTFLIYPVLFIKRNDDCAALNYLNVGSQVLTRFNGSILAKPCLLRETLTMTSYNSVQ